MSLERVIDEKPTSATDRIKESSLKYAGYGYLIGDAALFAHGMINHRPDRAFTGLAWGVGGLVPALYGKEPAERQLKRLSHQLGDFLSSQSVTIPRDSELFAKHLRHSPSTFDKIEDFLYAHPSELLNTAYAIGGTTLIHSGLSKPKPDPAEAASGALVTAGGLAGWLLPERKVDESKPASANGGLWEWMTEKPLRVSGLLYSLNNVTLLTSAFNERAANPANTSYYLKFLTAATYVVANNLLALSSKDQAIQGHDTQALETLERLAAQVIAAQPTEVQEGLIGRVSEFLATRPELASDAATLNTQLHQQIAKLSVDNTIRNPLWQGVVNPLAPMRGV